MAEITTHAAERYVQRINPRLTIDEARRELQRSAATIDIAAAFGAGVVLRHDCRLLLAADRGCTVTELRGKHHATR